MNPEFWRGKRVFLTGHTGFKGSWLSLWLQSLSAEVSGYALAPPTNPNLFTLAGVERGMQSQIADVRDLATLQKAMQQAKPEIVLHLAAQPLVRASYTDPVTTYSTNMMGTVHLLEAVRQTPGVRAVVNVTTDKCYENREWVWGYREDEPMGGHDPYSNSKGCSELITSAYRRSFFTGNGIALASARAGNVIGGGDWAQDRLVPDVLRAFETGQTAIIRNPFATRPWQHVLEPVAGYLALAERLHEEGASFAQAWNFGPRDDDARPVQWMVERLANLWGAGAHWQADGGSHAHEAHNLKLDISKAKHLLGWRPRWPLEITLSNIVEWHQAYLKGTNMHSFALQQIADYAQTLKD